MPEQASRPTPAVMAFIDQFAELLVQAGMPRMPSRIFVCLLVQDEGRMSAAELAERLQISPAAISGAVRYLVQVDLIVRERPAGSRRDIYRVYDDAWYEVMTQRDQLLRRWAEALTAGVQTMPPGSPGRARLEETLDFIEFMAAELPALLDRWREHRASATPSPLKGRTRRVRTSPRLGRR